MKSWAGALAAAAALTADPRACAARTTRPRRPRVRAAPHGGRRACGGAGARSRGAGAAQGPRLQRRCYWLLESEDDIVLVHYLNVDKSKGRPEEAPPGIEHDLVRRLGTTVTSGVAPVRPRPAARCAELCGAPSPPPQQRAAHPHSRPVLPRRLLPASKPARPRDPPVRPSGLGRPARASLRRPLLGRNARQGGA